MNTYSFDSLLVSISATLSSPTGIVACFSTLLLIFFITTYITTRANSKASHLRNRLEEVTEHLQVTTELYTEQKVKNATLISRMESEQKHHQEKLALLEDARESLRLQFAQLAQQILEEKSSQFNITSKERIETLLQPLSQQLTSLRENINTVHHNDTKERASLKQELYNLRILNQQITEEAANLTRALRGDKKIQGNWGELVLERVLEHSGLRKGIEFDVQGSFRNHNNELLKPDVIIHLPDQKSIIIDSKVSLVNWEKYTTSDTPAEQLACLKQLTGDVRNHISGLSGKNYSKLEGLQSLDFVLLFMPIETAFATLVQHDEHLISYALQEKIVFATPTTLLATLKTIENIWRAHQQSKNSQEIARKAGIMYDKLRLFLEDMERLGRQISTCQKSYDGAINKLSQGRGNLISQAEQLHSLGIQAKKELPSSMTDQADYSYNETMI